MKVKDRQGCCCWDLLTSDIVASCSPFPMCVSCQTWHQLPGCQAQGYLTAAAGTSLRFLPSLECPWKHPMVTGVGSTGHTPNHLRSLCILFSCKSCWNHSSWPSSLENNEQTLLFDQTREKSFHQQSKDLPKSSYNRNKEGEGGPSYCLFVRVIFFSLLLFS